MIRPMTKRTWNESNRRASGFSRRRFLHGLGTGAAGAAALGPGTALAAPEREQGLVTQLTPADRFGRIFTDLPTFVPPNDRTRAALLDIGKAGGIMDARDNLAAGPVQLIVDATLS